MRAPELKNYSLQTIESILRQKSDFREVRALEGFSAALVSAQKAKGRTLLVAPGDRANQIFHNLRKLGKNSLYFPENMVLPYEDKPPESSFAAFRIKTLMELLDREEVIVVSTPEALFYPLLLPEILKIKTLSISRGERINPLELSERLIDLGYGREEQVELLGSFSRRGDIIDIFSPTYPDPIRIETEWDEVGRISIFAAENQSSYRQADSVRVIPPDEWRAKVHDSEDISGAIGHFWNGSLQSSVSFVSKLFGKGGYFDNTILIELEEIDACFHDLYDKAELFFDRFGDGRATPETIFERPSETVSSLKEKAILIESMDGENIGIDSPSGIYAEGVLMPPFDDGNAVFYTDSPSGRDRVKTLCLKYPGIRDMDSGLLGGFVILDKDRRIGVITDQEVIRRNPPQPKIHIYRESTAFLMASDLGEGDYVVHQDHGIGIFRGLKSIDFGGRPTECLELEYAEKAKLLVPIEDFHLVQKYFGQAGTLKLSKLGGSGWSKTKERAQKSIRALAGELLHIAALREAMEGFSHPEAIEFRDILDATFPYETTDDQKRAISEIDEDLSLQSPADRLLCGDVGFGKTEVAIRAAARVVAGGKQVAVLVPTTILAQQHYQTFRSRYEDLPVRIEVFSRFVAKGDQRRIIDHLGDGKVDIIIGTHRLLSKDVSFKNLGLLIVDEEQRFGVADKEKIKKYRANIDILTLTATPIPRTLSFSMGGLRDLSIIATPPEQRLPIFTKMISFDESLIKEAVNKEIERGGQVFFLHNRVKTISAMYSFLHGLFPELKIGIAHGQLPSQKLSRVIEEFRDGRYQILLTTTVIEAGTDIPSVNTILINRADRFGIADLYQLRGRVGRGGVQAFAYLITPEYKLITTSARKRLKAILSHTQLGSGFNLAMRDLEIRGAGDILGKKQSGVISQIGMSLYSKLLSQTVSQLKNESAVLFAPPSIDLDFHIGIPSKYIPSAQQRIQIYQRAFTVSTEKKLKAVFTEVRDRFGNFPEDVRQLEEYLEARIIASTIPVTAISLKGKYTSIVFQKEGAPTLYDLTRGIIDNNIIAGFDFNPNLILKIQRPGEETQHLVTLNIALRQLRDWFNNGKG